MKVKNINNNKNLNDSVIIFNIIDMYDIAANIMNSSGENHNVDWITGKN